MDEEKIIGEQELEKVSGGGEDSGAEGFICRCRNCGWQWPPKGRTASVPIPTLRVCQSCGRGPMVWQQVRPGE